MRALKLLLIAAAGGGILLIVLIGEDALPGAKEGMTNPQTTDDRLIAAEALRNEGAYAESLDLAQKALEEAEQLDDPKLVVEAHYQSALSHHYMEEYEQARSHLEIGLAEARVHKLPKLEADLLNALGIIEWKLGNLGPATRILEQTLEIWRQMGLAKNMANVSNNLGIIEYARKDYRKAVEHYRNGIEWMGSEASERLKASLYSNLAESLIPLDQLDEAGEYLSISLEIEKREKDPHNLAYTYFNLGELRARQGRSLEAVELYERALELQLSIDNDWAAALTRLRTAAEYHKAGRQQQALDELMTGYEAAKNLNAITLLRDYADLFARIYETRGEMGQSRYYGELNEWFAARLQENPAEPEAAVNLPLTEPAKPGNSKLVLTMRTATLGIIAILIILLLLENLRLRKRMQRD